MSYLALVIGVETLELSVVCDVCPAEASILSRVIRSQVGDSISAASPEAAGLLRPVMRLCQQPDRRLQQPADETNTASSSHVHIISPSLAGLLLPQTAQADKCFLVDNQVQVQTVAAGPFEWAKSRPGLIVGGITIRLIAMDLSNWDQPESRKYMSKSRLYRVNHCSILYLGMRILGRVLWLTLVRLSDYTRSSSPHGGGTKGGRGSHKAVVEMERQFKKRAESWAGSACGGSIFVAAW